MKFLIPKSLKPKIVNGLRRIKDYRSKDYLKFAKPQEDCQSFPFKIELSQPLKKNSGLEAKVKNMKKAIAVLETIVINPSEIFSFWKYLDEPTIQNGYFEGRTIVNGKLETSIGGGLCQLGGLIYHISLLGNLDILERHNHSLDLYNDQTRYSPLGADAAVAFGYKDLRVKNTYSFPIKFEFRIQNDNIEIYLVSAKPIIQVDPKFEIENYKDHKLVKTYIHGKQIETSYYKNGDQI